MVRIAVLDTDRCKPKRCDRVCYRFCPKVRSKIEAIVFEEEMPQVVEALCVGCGICVKKCPFKAITIVNQLNRRNIFHLPARLLSSLR